MGTLSPERIRAEFIKGDEASSPPEKGQVLENLTKYLFRQVSGVDFYRADVLNSAGSGEIDLIFWNAQVPDGLYFLENVLLFECKNWSNPVDSATISHFVTKLNHRNLKIGFLIASSGITGDSVQLRAAHDLIDASFINTQLKVLVFTREELESLESTDELIRLIQEKIMDLTLRVRTF